MAQKKISVSMQFVLLLLLIFALNSAAFFYMLQNVYIQELRSQAQTVVANVEAFGTWVAKNGRVWVKDNSDSYLGEMAVVSEEDASIKAHFYSKNPALAQREFSEAVAASSSPAKFRMTSINVMNPNNAPDMFESRALSAIGFSSLTDYSESSGDTYRYAKPVYHTASCIACHGSSANAPADVLAQYGSENGFGFKVGDVAGIISVSIPKRNVLSSAVSIFGLIEVGAILVSVLLILWFVRRYIISPISELTVLAQNVSKGKVSSFDVSNIDSESRNEIDQLKLATGRMNTSFLLAIRKMTEARRTAQQAIKVAKALKEKHEGKPK